VYGRLQACQSTEFPYLCATQIALVRKFFALDKNYLLEGVQLRLQDRLLVELIDRARSSYEQIHNPLGLDDAFSEKISRYLPKNLQPLYTFYQNLAGIYRYKYGENQLGFLWDGKDHADQYGEDWNGAFQVWTTRLCCNPQFVQSVLDLTVFMPENQHTHLAENRMNAVMLELFDVKIHKQKGIVEMRVA
jgi:hypothetical protein